MPTSSYQKPDVVLGQLISTDTERNSGGEASAASMLYPSGVWSDGDHLWVADTGNRRVLFYETIPTKNYQPADKVIGKAGFDEKDYDTEHAVWSYSIKVSENGVLAIVDTQYYRVLLWNNWEDAFIKTADTIIGQPDLNNCGQNQYRLKPAANTLNWCYDMFLQNGSLWLADTGNSRILFFKEMPTANNQPADELFGNFSFEAIGEHLDVGKQDSERLYWPFAVTVADEQLVVADTGNHRIVFYDI